MRCFGLINFTNDNDISFVNNIEYNQHFKNINTGNISLFYGSDQFSSSNNWFILQSACSIFIGKGFEKDTYKPVTMSSLPTNFNQHDTFNKFYWGDYLLITTDPSKKSFKFTRSPSCQLPLFYALSKEKLSFATSIELLQHLLPHSLQPNWDYLISYLYEGTLLGPSTPFMEVEELPLGCSMYIDKHQRSVSLSWTPLDYIENENQLDINDYSEQLYETLKNVFKSWMYGIDHIFLEFSGGIDSTALHFALFESLHLKKAKYHPVHLFNPLNHACDERNIAKDLASMTNTPLMELNYLKCLPCANLSLSFKPDKPDTNLIFQNAENYFLSVVDPRKKFQFVNGHAGDNLLMSHPYYDILTDYILNNGLKGSYKYAKDFAAYFRTNIYEVLGGVLRGYSSYFGGLKLELGDKNFHAPWLKINPKKYFTNKSFCHPFFFEQVRLFPGKQRQINDLYEVFRLVYTTNVRSPGNYIFYPFISQPIMELILSAPTHYLFQNSYDRFVIRKAIAERYATPHIWRRDKGEFSSLNMRGLEENYNFVLDLILKGEFASKHYVDKNLLKKSLQDVIAGDFTLQWPLLRLISLEMFLKYWL